MPELTTAYRLKAQQPSEIDLLGQILDYLRYEQARGKVAWFARVNGGGTWDKTGRFLRFYMLYLQGKKPAGKGKADIEGQLMTGAYFALEVKRPGQTVTPEQQAFIEAVRAGAGIAGVVTSYVEARALLTL